MSANRKTQRINSVFAAKEWSDRDPDFAWYQLGGLHYAPLTGEKHQAKAQVTHATQQRFYAAVLHFMCGPEIGYDEAMNALLDATKIGVMAQKYNPQFCSDRLINSRVIAEAATAEELALSAFPGAKTL